jgi:hypothetical protein
LWGSVGIHMGWVHRLRGHFHGLGVHEHCWEFRGFVRLCNLLRLCGVARGFASLFALSCFALFCGGGGGGG